MTYETPGQHNKRVNREYAIERATEKDAQFERNRIYRNKILGDFEELKAEGFPKTTTLEIRADTRYKSMAIGRMLLGGRVRLSRYGIQEVIMGTVRGYAIPEARKVTHSYDSRYEGDFVSRYPIGIDINGNVYSSPHDGISAGAPRDCMIVGKRIGTLQDYSESLDLLSAQFSRMATMILEEKY